MKVKVLDKVIDTDYICYISGVVEWNTGGNYQTRNGMKFDIKFYHEERGLPILYPKHHNGQNTDEWLKEHKPKFQKLHDELMVLWNKSTADIPKLTIE